MPVKPITIKLDKNRSLRYGMPNLCILEDELGFSLPQLMKEMTGQQFAFNTIVKLLWAGLLEVEEDGRWKETNLTIPQVSNLMKPAELDEYATKIAEALNSAFAKPGDDDPKN